MAGKTNEQEGYGENISVDPRRPGKFYVRIWHNGVNYKRRAASLSHARQRVHDIKAAIAKGEWPPKPKPKAATFDELLKEYRTAKQREGKAIMRTTSMTIGYTRLLDNFAGRRADSLTAAEVEAMRDKLLATMAPATVNRHLQLLRAILLRGVRDHRLSRDAVPQITLFKENNQRVEYLTGDEERRLLAACTDWLRPLVVVAIHTGMRRGELLNLTWPDVDFVDAGVIFVRRSKSGEGRRIPMSPTVHRTLGALRDARRARLTARVVEHKAASPYVFTAPEGGFIHNLNPAWYAALKEAKLEGFRFHDLRHTFASRLMMNGVGLYRVQILLGHKTAAMTQRYAHLDPEHLRAAVATLDAPGPKPWAEKKAEPARTNTSLPG